MAAPTSPLDLNTTASSNGPDGATEQVSVLDDYIRGLSASVKHLVVKGSDIASAATVTPAATASFFDITGTTGITAIGSTNSWDGRIVWFQFDGALTITHASTLKLPGAVNYTTAAGDVLAFVQETSGTWRCVQALRADGAILGSDWSIDSSGRLLNGGATQPSFAANASATLTANGAFATFTELHDVGSNFNASTGVFTAPVTGKYFITFTISSSTSSGTGRAVAFVNVGGSILPVKFAAGGAIDSSTTYASASGVISLTASDQVTVDLNTLTGTGAASVCTYFSGYLLG